MTAKQRKQLSTVLKFVVSAALLYFIFTKIDFNEVTNTLRDADPFWLVAALLLFVISKVFNALRLNLYFHAIGVPLSQGSNLKLYLLGMFYNLFLPGGIGGDAYKGYLIKKQFQVKTKKVIGVLLVDRLSGMVIILCFSLVLATIMKQPVFEGFQWIFIAAIPIGIGCFWILHKYWFSYALKVFWGSLGYSTILQSIQLAATYCIILALGVDGNIWAYLFTFMISSIVAVVPLTIGGVGSREVTFLYGAQWLGLDAPTSIGISFTFFLITALVSFTGIAYHFKKPSLETVPS